MEMRDLRYFDAVARTCHFGEAADLVHVAQPALSQAISRLEKELGVALFDRTTRRVDLTPAGEYLHVQTARLLADVDAMTEGVRHIANGTSGVLRMGFTGTTAFTHLAQVSRILRSALPGVALEVSTDLLTPAQVHGLTSGRLDMGVLRGDVDGDGVVTRSLGTEALVAAIPVDHRLADQPELGMADFVTETFVVFSDERSSVNAQMIASCRKGGFTPRSTHSAPDTAGILALVAAGFGVAFVPESVRTMRPHGVVFRDVADAEATDIALAVRADASSPIVRNALHALEAAGFFDPKDDA